MEATPQIRFRGMDPSPALSSVIEERIGRLATFHDRITACSVVIEAPHRHQHKGKVFHVRIDITVPGQELVIGREPEADQAHEEALVAVNRAFDAAERRLEDMVRRASGHRVKTHAEKLHCTVLRLLAEDGFGFIGTEDGREVYFHRDSLTSPGQWPKLAAGSTVRFTAHDGEKGPFASSVTMV